jgi:hypothetical protein
LKGSGDRASPNDADIDAVLKKLGGEAVPQNMDVDPFVGPRRGGCGTVRNLVWGAGLAITL